MIELWAEAGSCDKSVAKALDYAEAVYKAGASALKVQWYTPETVFTPDAPRYDNTSGPASTQWEAGLNPIYPYNLWEPVIDFCRDKDIKFVPSVFDFEAIDVANEFELPILKIASGDLTYHKLIRAASDGRQVALSTGGATLDEVEAAYNNLSNRTHILMACHLEYPTPYHRANLARSYALQYHFPMAVPGFSDHTPGIDTIPLITATGCQVIEKHFTLEADKGYDSDFALTPELLEEAVQKIQGTLGVMGDADLTPDAEEQAALAGARRSPYARVTIPANTTITSDKLIMLRPSYGPNPQDASKLIGRSFGFDIGPNEPLPFPTDD